MISVEQALAEILAQVPNGRPTFCALSDSVGRTLAEDIQSDIDSPPYDKSLVDGYAVIAADIHSGVTLEVLEAVMAGETPTQSVQPGTAIQVMTGAPLPPRADAVVMVEQTTRDLEGVTIEQASIQTETNVMRQATSLAQGETILTRGTIIRPIEV